MSRTAYQRVTAQAPEHAAAPSGSHPDAGPSAGEGGAAGGVRWFVIPLSVILCIVQALATIFASNTQSQNVQVTSTLISVFAMTLLFLTVLLFNPLLRLIYLGNLLPASASEVCELAMRWSGRLTLAAALALPVLLGPAFPHVGLALLFALAGVGVLADLVVGVALSRPGLLSRPGWVVFRWTIALACVLGLMLAIPAGPLAAGMAVFLPCAAVYVVLWTFFSRGLNRAELTTVAAALIVTSGISTVGLCESLVPLISTPFNPVWNTPQAGWDNLLIPNLQKKLYITDAKTIQDFRQGLRQTADGREIIAPDQNSAGLAAWVGFYSTVARNLPWVRWLPPLGYWSIFILGCYALFYSLAYTVLGHWSLREKIVFPLAKLPESLLPEEDGHAWFPSLIRSPVFWAGVLPPVLLLSYNGCLRAGFIGGMGYLPLGMSGANFSSYVQGSLFEGLGGGTRSMRFSIFFTAIGIAFLLPLDISFSIWFYYLFGRAILLILVWTGHGRDMRDFPDDWLWAQNPVSAQGAGAILVFSAVLLYRAVKDSVTQVLARARGWGAWVLALLPIAGLVVSLLVVSAWVWWVWQWDFSYMAWALVFVLVLMLTTLGLMRISAEGGVYWYSANASFFHFWKALGLGSALPGALVGPLLPIYSVLFLDVRTFIAPNLAVTGKMQEPLHPPGRGRFHLNMILTILVSMACSIGFAIVLAYARGANRMRYWLYSGAPRALMDTASQAATSLPKFDAGTSSWMGLGAVWIVITFLLRRWFFWFPHPIGYVLMVNPLMDQLWFSFFVGWVCKKLAVQYGGKATFQKLRGFFLGLIIGELAAIFFWMVLSVVYSLPPTFITLSRYD